MRAVDLDHKELLELDPDSGVISFAGQRAILLDAVAMGFLRKYLVENFGLLAARTVLTQFGFAHGWRMAEALHAEFRWENDAQWRDAGTRLHTLEGMFTVHSGSQDPLSQEGVLLSASYEAEQHLLHFGRAQAPMCWTICGLISGYLSKTAGKEIFVLEDRCVGNGHAACHLFGRTREAWGDEHAQELRFFEATPLKDCLEVSLHRVTESLKATEKKLRDQQKALVQVLPDLTEPLLGVVAKSEAMRRILDLARAVLAMKRKISGFSPAAADQLVRYDWPGNVRELENAMERAVALALGNRVELDDLPEEVREAAPKVLPTAGQVRSLEDVEKDYILAVMGLNEGNQTHAARQLKIGSATLYRKLKSYGLTGVAES